MESQNVPEEGQGSLTPHEYLRYRDPGSDEWTYLDPWKDQYRQGETGDWSKFGKTPVGSMASAQSASSGGRLGSKAVRSSRAGEGPGGMTPLYLGSGVDEQKLLFKYGTQSASEGAQEGLTMNEQREMTSIVPTAGQPWLSDPNMSKKDRKRAEKLWKQQDKKRVKAQKASTKTKKAGGSRAQVEITDARGRTKMVYEGSAGHREAQAREAMASTTEGVASSTGGVASSGLQTAGSLGDRMASSTGGVASSTGGPTPTGQQDSVLEEALSALGAGTGTSYGGSGSGVTGPGSPWTSGETRQFGFGSNTSRPTAKTSNYGTDSSPAGFRW
jgi:hypothetical protein